MGIPGTNIQNPGPESVRIYRSPGTTINDSLMVQKEYTSDQAAGSVVRVLDSQQLDPAYLPSFNLSALFPFNNYIQSIAPALGFKQPKPFAPTVAVVGLYLDAQDGEMAKIENPESHDVFKGTITKIPHELMVLEMLNASANTIAVDSYNNGSRSNEAQGHTLAITKLKEEAEKSNISLDAVNLSSSFKVKEELLSRLYERRQLGASLNKDDDPLEADLSSEQIEMLNKKLRESLKNPDQRNQTIALLRQDLQKVANGEITTRDPRRMLGFLESNPLVDLQNGLKTCTAIDKLGTVTVEGRTLNKSGKEFSEKHTKRVPVFVAAGNKPDTVNLFSLSPNAITVGGATNGTLDPQSSKAFVQETQPYRYATIPVTENGKFMGYKVGSGPEKVTISASQVAANSDHSQGAVAGTSLSSPEAIEKKILNGDLKKLNGTPIPTDINHWLPKP